MNNQAYWARRQSEREAKWHDLTTAELRKLKRYYVKAAADIEREVAALYAKYADENGLTMTAARKLIRGSEFKSWRMTLEEYVAASKADPKILRELNTLAMRSRISRFEALHARTLMETIDLAERLQDAADAHFARAYLETYYGNLYDLHKTVGLSVPPNAVDAKRVESVLQTAWVGKNYSSRIWANQTKLAKELEATLLQAIHRGSSIQQLSKALSRRMDVAYSNAERLVRTELNAVENRASAEAMRTAEFTHYQFMATLDRRTCARCGERDGEVYRLSEMNQGENAPPLHARCRCTIVAYDGLVYGTRATRSDDGKYQRVPADMSYRDWKAVYIDKTKTLETWQAEFAVRRKADEQSPLRQRGRAIIDKLAAGRLPTAASGAKVTIDKGALNENNDPGGKKRNAHAEMFYAARRNSKKEPWVKRIAQNSGMSEKAISKIFDHVFIKEHDLWDGRHTFLPDYYMAESFRRLHEGKNIQPHDMILLRHEWLELSLMNRYDYDYDTAHNITERKYNYKFALIEWHKRMGIPWNG